MSSERFEVTRPISATPTAIFAVLADPVRHCDTEPTDWVRDAVDAEPITGVGQIFAMNMYLEAAGGDYVTYNLVTEFEKDHAIAWMPGGSTMRAIMLRAAGSGATNSPRKATTQTSHSPTTGPVRPGSSGNRSAACRLFRRITSARRWPIWSAR